jgi:hypothetical protein
MEFQKGFIRLCKNVKENWQETPWQAKAAFVSCLLGLTALEVYEKGWPKFPIAYENTGNRWTNEHAWDDKGHRINTNHLAVMEDWRLIFGDQYSLYLNSTEHKSTTWTDGIVTDREIENDTFLFFGAYASEANNWNPDSTLNTDIFAVRSIDGHIIEIELGDELIYYDESELE